MITLERIFPYLMIAGSVLVIANVVWAFLDAKKRGRSGILIALLVFWTFPLGVILWLILRPPIARLSRSADFDADIKARANAGLL